MAKSDRNEVLNELLTGKEKYCYSTSFGYVWHNDECGYEDFKNIFKNCAEALSKRAGSTASLEFAYKFNDNTWVILGCVYNGSALKGTLWKKGMKTADGRVITNCYGYGKEYGAETSLDMFIKLLPAESEIIKED